MISLYLLVWIIMCVLFARDLLLDTSEGQCRIEFEICFVILSGMLILRYGQGTDYFGYMVNYLRVSDESIALANYKGIHGELGWQFLSNIFRCAGANFEVFIAFVSLVQVIALHRFARVYSIQNAFTLIWLYPTLILTYCFSGIRQGIVMAVFLGFLLPLLERRRYIYYCIGVLLLMSIHSSAAILLVLPFVAFIPVQILQIVTIVVWLIGILLGTDVGRTMIVAIGSSGLNYYIGDRTSSPSYFAIAERLLFLTIITICYARLQRTHENMDDRISLWYRCYLVSIMIYAIFCWDSFISSRFGGVIRYVEVLLLYAFIRSLHICWRRMAAVAVICYTGLMTIKNLNTYCIQGSYAEEISGWNYPYVSIFNSDHIYEIRDVRDNQLRFLRKNGIDISIYNGAEEIE